ncbi:hypothetical protein B0J14DRAFT_231341 [Halenospora varia]|nr:hypothetical protein B0J14DRAFT_231341 [Halenospora varia]
MIFPRDDDDVEYISPEKEVNVGLWTLFAGATVFLGLRLWCKYTRRTGLWYDDYVLIASWVVLMVTDIIITAEFATGYSSGYWDDRMHILINISSCGTLIGQAWSKSALGITLLRMSNKRQMAILWFCLISMNIFMILKVFFQWAKYCGKKDYQNWYRIQGPCINYTAEEDIKVAGNTYNIIMDFIFACFPWWITWSLEKMRRIEKFALCATMSLGMVVAIISAVRTTWKDREIMHVHDEYYIWRNGMSNIWYSAEVAGTIIVQCIPILRPFLRDIHVSLTSKKISDAEGCQSNTWRSRGSTLVDAKRGSGQMNGEDNGRPGPDTIPLSVITEEHDVKKDLSIIAEEQFDTRKTSSSPLGSDKSKICVGPLFGDAWPLSGKERTNNLIRSAQYNTWIDLDDDQPKGLSPPPSRIERS